MVAALRLGRSGVIRGGSSPLSPIKYQKKKATRGAWPLLVLLLPEVRRLRTAGLGGGTGVGVGISTVPPIAPLTTISTFSFSSGGICIVGGPTKASDATPDHVGVGAEVHGHRRSGGRRDRVGVDVLVVAGMYGLDVCGLATGPTASGVLHKTNLVRSRVRVVVREPNVDRLKLRSAAAATTSSDNENRREKDPQKRFHLFPFLGFLQVFASVQYMEML